MFRAGKTTYIPGKGALPRHSGRTVHKAPTIVTVHPSGHITATGPGAAKAAAAEARRRRAFAPILHAVTTNPSLPTPLEALYGAYYQGKRPAYAQYGQLYGPKLNDILQEAYVQHLAGQENIHPVEDLTNAVTVATGLGGIARAAGEIGAKEVASATAKEALGQAAKETASATESQGLRGLLSRLGAGARTAASEGVVRSAAKRAGTALEPDVVRAIREAAAKKAASAAEKLPAAARTAGRAAVLPAQRPISSAFALQVPNAVITGNPRNLGRAVTPQGTLASVEGMLAGYGGNAVGGTAGQAAKEALNLPATVLPSLYMTGKAGVEAAQGNSQNLNKLWQEYLKTGLLPALVQGNGGKALKALENRPLYSALEASGALSAAGRGAGAVTRGLTNGKVGGRLRPDLTVEGYPNVRVQREYSPDLLRQLVQRASDRRSGNVIRPGTGLRLTPTLEKRGDYLFRKHVVRSAGDRFNAREQAIQRQGRTEAHQTVNELLPRKKGLARFRKIAPVATLDKASADVVVHAIQRIAQHPETFHADLTGYLNDLNKIAQEKHPNGVPVLDNAELKANREQAKTIETALKSGNPEHVVQAANAFIDAHAPIVQELIDRGVLSPEAAQMAAHIPFARVHMGATHGEPVNLIKDLENLHSGERKRFTREASATLKGHRDAIAKAEGDVKIAESGLTQAERTIATIRANLRQLRGKARLAKEGEAPLTQKEQGLLNSLKRAEDFRDASKKQLVRAKAEGRKAKRTLGHEIEAVSKIRDKRLEPIEAALKEVKGKETLLDKHGYPLTAEQIAAEMQRRGVESPGFISHRPGRRSDFFAPTTERGSLPKGHRTGKAASHGTYESGYEAVIRQLGRSRGLLDRIKTWDHFITRFGQKANGLNPKSMADAQKVIRDPARYGMNPNIEWVAVRRQPFTAMKSEIDAALKHQDPSLASEGILAGALDRATASQGPDGPIVFMPKQVVANMHEQFQPLSPSMKAIQLTSTGLKRAVLPFSPSYYFGNFLDNAIRTAIAGVGPQHFFAGRQVAKRMSEGDKASLIGAAYSSVDKLAARRTHEDFTGTALQGVMEAAHAFRTKPGPRHMLDLLREVSHTMLALNAKLTEQLPQYGALGKIAMQDVRNTQGQWAALLRLQPKYVEGVVKGLENSDTMIRYEKGLEQIYGNWSRMSPHARKFLSNFFPFWTWSRAALKLVYGTLPAHHPVITALLTASARMTQTEREKLGLDLLGKEPLPNFLQGGIPIRGSISPFGKYTSFGYAAHPYESVVQGVLPQGKEVLAAGEGRDWRGSPLGGGELSHIGIGLNAAWQTYVPGWNTVEGIISKGPGFLSPVHVESPGALKYLRSLSESEQITVPKHGSSSGSSSSSSGGINYGNAFGSSSGSYDYGAAFGSR